MFRKICLSLAALLCAMPLWSQVEPSATGGQGSTDDDSLMALSPSESGSFYPSSTGSQYRENTLSGGIIFTTAYDDNVLSGAGLKTIGAESYTILPNISINEKTSRFGASVRYSPGFMFYHPTTDLNHVTQNATADIQYRWTPHTVVGVQEVFAQNSTAFSAPYLVQGTTISGSANGLPPVVIVPYAGQVMDTTDGHISFQFSRRSMVSASGYFSSFNFSNAGQTTGLYDSHGGGGSGSYSHRLTRSQSLGFSYRYAITYSTPFPATTVTTVNQFESAFYSIVLGKNFSLSISGGPENSSTSSPGITTTHTWSPSGNASMGWQKARAVASLSYARAVTTGGGLLGSFQSDNAAANFGWLFTQRLSGHLNGNYGNTKSETPLIVADIPTGHTLFGRTSLEYRLGERLTLVGEYSRLHNSYGQIAVLAQDPNDDRVAITLNYGFTRPLGR